MLKREAGYYDKFFLFAIMILFLYVSRYIYIYGEPEGSFFFCPHMYLTNMNYWKFQEMKILRKKNNPVKNSEYV